MNGRRAKKLRRELRRLARKEVDGRLHGRRFKSTPKLWFRLYLRIAQLRALLGFPIAQGRIREVARDGIRIEAVRDPSMRTADA